MGRFFCATFLIVLCQFLGFTRAFGQVTDSAKSIVFPAQKGVSEANPKRSRLEGIVTVGVGPYSGFHSDGSYGSFIQPNVGFEFLAEPGDGLHLLLGGHLGISNPLTTGVSFGLRGPIYESKSSDLKVFGDLGFLVFDDAAIVGPLKYGVRFAFGARTVGPVDIEYRLAAEWRGTGSDSVDEYRTRMLWWVGAEVGIAFSLVSDTKAFSRKDSLRASLHYIASGEEMDELEAISSDLKMDQWLERFWRIRDLTPETKLNEARIEYEKRSETADRMFSSKSRLGVLEDPGRVMAIYGFPDTEDKEHSITDDRVQYMLWVYNGRVKDVSFATFIFRSSDYGKKWEQIYSNVPGELSGNLKRDLPISMRKWVQ